MIAFFYFAITFFITLNILYEDWNLLSVLFATVVFLLGGFLSLKAFEGLWQDDVVPKYSDNSQAVHIPTEPDGDSLREQSSNRIRGSSKNSTASDSPLRHLVKIISLAEIPLFLYFWVSAIVSGGLWGAISGVISGGILTFVSLLSIYLGLIIGVPVVLLTEISVNESFLYVRLWWSFINAANHWFANVWDESSPSIQEIWMDAF